MEYNECKVLCKLNKKSEPLITEVPLDEFTEQAQKNFDYDFTGISEVYPFELPEEILNLEFNILCITGASGSGKSTLLKEFLKNERYRVGNKSFNSNKAIISNFNTPEESVKRLSAVGLNSIPVWCRPRRVLSVGEGFRADVALNLDNYTLFDEFTSTIDRTVAMSTCNGIKSFIKSHNLHNIVFCSCHKDFIPYLNPDIVIDLDDECVYDCRGQELKKACPYKSIEAPTKICGEYLGSIII